MQDAVIFMLVMEVCVNPVKLKPVFFTDWIDLDGLTLTITLTSRDFTALVANTFTTLSTLTSVTPMVPSRGGWRGRMGGYAS